MNRKEKLITGECYHIYNRGVEKRLIFPAKKDYHRFLDTLFHYLTTNEKYSDTNAPHANQQRNVETAALTKYDLDFKKRVELLAYCLMPNHFHLLLKQLVDGGITKYMHRITTSFTKFFNTKTERVGPLLQGRFKYKRIESEEQLLHVSKYIHRNPLESSRTKLTAADDLINYPWSSFAAYLSEDNFFILKDPVLGTFSSPEKYGEFVLEDYDEKQIATLDVLRLD